jgi:hypothetical protein
MNIDAILEKYNVKYNDLTNDERETLHSWITALSNKKITIELIKENIIAMKTAVEQELCKVGHNNKEDLFMKARLRNYMLLEAFLESPEKAKKALEQSLSGLVNKKA